MEEQTSSVVASPMADPPWEDIQTPQGNAVVWESDRDLGGSPTDQASGDSMFIFYIKPCQGRGCKTCPNLLIENYFQSTVTGQRYKVENHNYDKYQ